MYVQNQMNYSESLPQRITSSRPSAEPQSIMTKKSMLTFLFLLTRNVWLNCITFAILLGATPGNCAPSVDFAAPPLGDYDPITGHVSQLAAPSEYEVLLLDSQNNKIWWDKTHNVHGIPIADDRSFSCSSSASEKGWINNTNVLKAPFLGVLIVSTNFGTFSVGGGSLPEKTLQVEMA